MTHFSSIRLIEGRDILNRTLHGRRKAQGKVSKMVRVFKGHIDAWPGVALRGCRARGGDGSSVLMDCLAASPFH
jgi:hypothetical protein